MVSLFFYWACGMADHQGITEGKAAQLTAAWKQRVSQEWAKAVCSLQKYILHDLLSPSGVPVLEAHYKLNYQ